MPGGPRAGLHAPGGQVPTSGYTLPGAPRCGADSRCMEDWRPRPRTAVDLRGLPLDAEEGFLLSRLDGATSLPELRALTGLGTARLQHLLGRLVALGAIEAPGPSTPKTPAPPGATPNLLGVTPAPLGATPTLPGVTPAPPVAPAAPPGATPVPRGAAAAPPDAVAAQSAPPAPRAASPLHLDPGAAEGAPGAVDHGATTEVPAGPEEDPVEQEGQEAEARNLSARALFGQHLRHLDEVERSTRAAVAVDPELSAFCFDPLPSVARALLGNPRFTAAHARMLARFHHSPTGLEALAVRGALARDPVVERCLLRNPQLPGGAARRMLTPLRLLRLWLLHVDRELPELARKLAKDVLRSRFGSAPVEERVDLILRTDGRVLMALGGVPVDGRTTSLLCQRSYRSPLLILNLVRWSACPVPLLVHLWNQPAVRQQLQLRQALLRHPNLPSELKRSG